MGVNDPQYVALGYYEDLESKLLKHSTVLLIGPRFSGKTTGVEFISRKLRLGPIKHLQMEKLEQRNLQEVRELLEAAEKKGEGAEDKTVIEGSAYRIAYARHNGGEMDPGGYRKWLAEKNERMEAVKNDERTVVAELTLEDVEALFVHFGAGNLEEGKRKLLVRLASYNGKVIIPLLKKVVEKHGGKSLEELEKMVDAEEKLISFVELMLLIEKESWMKIGERLINLLLDFLGLVDYLLGPMAGVPVLARRVVTIFFGISNLRVSREGRLARILQLRDAWGGIPVEKRIRICEEIDEKLGLFPGSSYEFLKNWLERSERQLLEEISRILTPDFITQLRQIVDEYEDVRKELDNISKKLESLEAELEKVVQAVDRLEKFTLIYNSLKESCDEVYPKLMHPTKDRGIPPPIVFETDWIGLGIDVVKGTVGRYQLVKSGEFECYAKKIEDELKNGKVVIVVGNRGIGKSVLTRYVLAKLIRENDNIWVVTPKPSEPGKNWPVVLASQANDFSRRFHTHIIIYYDPSAPEVYWGIEKTGKPGAVEEDMIEAVREAYVNARATGGVSALLVIPSDFEEIIDKISKKLEKHKVKAHIIEMDLRQEGFLKDIMKAYSGCEDIPDELVEGVREFSSYTLVAKLAGEWLRGKCDKARVEVEAALRESEKNAKRFIARYIRKAIFQGVKLARIEAIPLLIRAHFGPIPRKFFEKPFIIRDGELIIQDIFDVIGQDEQADEQAYAFTTWLSTPKEDLIEEVLKEIALGEENQLGEEFKDFINAVGEGKRIVLKESKSMRLKEEDLVSLLSEYLYLLSLSSKYLFRMLQEELEGEDVECWRRVIYILGSAISGHPFEPLFTAFRELYRGEELFRTAEKHKVDDWLLVYGEVPLLVRGVLVMLAILTTAGSFSFITPGNRICEEAEKVAGFIESKGISLPLVPYMVGLALASLNTCKGNREAGRNALYLLHWPLSRFGPLADPDLISDIIAVVGESLDWPEELTPILLELSISYTHSAEQVESVSEIANQLYKKKNEMKGWAKAYLAKTYSQLALHGMESDEAREYLRRAEEYFRRAKELREEVKKGDEKMGLITDVEALDDVVAANFMLGNIGEAEKALEYLSEALQKLETEGKEILQSDCVKEYLRYRSLGKPEEAIQWVLEDVRRKHLRARALIELDKGVRENSKDRLSKAAEDFSKAAELAKNLGEEENYVGLRGKSAGVRVLLMDKLSEEVLKEFGEIWRIALESRRPTRRYLHTLASALARHLVALALSGGDWRGLLEEHRVLLELDPRRKVATLYMLNILAGCKEKPSDEEAYSVAGVMERVKEMKEKWNEELRVQMIRWLKDLGVEIEGEVKDEELWELLLPRNSLSQFILLLKALSNGDYRLAKLHAQVERNRSFTPSGLFGELAEALEECEGGGLTDRVKLALAKLFYFHF
ncbi:MAG: hypothetical protein QXT28_12320 [Thermofilaceae archaeon]